jgi:hypothetical protein
MKGQPKMKWIALVIGAALVCGGTAAKAEDAAAQFTIKLFTDACMANFGHQDRVEAWASERDLPQIVNRHALQVYVGPAAGPRAIGRAWAAQDASGRFVLSTRVDPESCVVWAQVADQNEIVAAFTAMADQAKKPGVQVLADPDKILDIPDGKVRIQVYRVWSGSSDSGMALMAATVSRSGGPFQAMIENQRLFAVDDPIDPKVPMGPPKPAAEDLAPSQ